VVSYNTRQKTVQCIHSIKRSTTRIPYEVIVVDNASTDGSAEAIRATFPDVKLIASPDNLGFGLANNLAENHARGRRVLLLNPDTVVLDHAIDNLHKFACSTPDRRVWGGRCLDQDGRVNRSCANRMTLWNTLGFALGISFLLDHPEEFRGWKYDTFRTVDVISGSFLLIDRDLCKHCR